MTSFLDVRDLISAFELLVERGKVYNASNSSAYRIGDLVRLFEQRIGQALNYVIDKALLRPSYRPGM